MNLTIPIMEGQTATICVLDGKTKEQFSWICDHRSVICLRSHGKEHLTIFKHEATADDESLFVKGIGRNKIKCPKSLKLKVK